MKEYTVASRNEEAFTTFDAHEASVVFMQRVLAYSGADPHFMVMAVHVDGKESIAYDADLPSQVLLIGMPEDEFYKQCPDHMMAH